MKAERYIHGWGTGGDLSGLGCHFDKTFEIDNSLLHLDSVYGLGL